MKKMENTIDVNENQGETKNTVRTNEIIEKKVFLNLNMPTLC